MTDRARHIRRTGTPEKILTAGLATATCVGLVGMLGVRMVEASAAATDPVDLAVASQPQSAARPVTEATSSGGLTEAQLDAYAAALAQEKERLDAYRAKLVKTATKLRKQARAQAGAPARQWAPASGARPAAPAGSAATAQPAPRPVAKPKPAPAPQAAPAPKPATPQSTSQGS